MSKSQTQDILHKYAIRPRHTLGQNFLIDDQKIDRLVEIAGPTREDRVIEIGAGLGALTRPLAEQAGRVVAVELDRRLVPVLQETLKPYEHATVLCRDGLELDEADPELAPDKTHATLIVANLPYYLTTPLVEHLLCAFPGARRLVLTLQEEAADRLLSGPGSRAYGPTGLLLWAHGRARRVMKLSPSAFYPKPHVASTVISIDRSDNPIRLLETPESREHYLRFLKTCFQQRRKKLANNLAALYPRPVEPLLEKSGLLPHVRPEQVMPEDYLLLYQTISAIYPNSFENKGENRAT